MFGKFGSRKAGPHRFKEIFDELPRETQELLNSRYGVSGTSYWRYLALVALAIGLPWLMWSAWYHSNPAARVTLVSFTPIDDRSIEITFDLDRKDSTIDHTCTLIARDYEKNVVGEIDIPVAPSATNPVEITATIPTRLAAVNAGVLECRPSER
ncbi:MAG: DUF4307 domain-containing protein [Actinobacteria bacterium]|jgi:hypothetical protein|nr:DUF4307 domain-containing protein [Actinomycetota bacterium]NCV83107.1 DUF4307 domain-containing protein [Actinomycetota bacterium]NCV95500.1 DUF4307 domain-containing protein [Actinomycetota bacterium]NDE47696.1 DUF4307 domain-containing protein [Actinomycetota bacterium]NDE95954.1 DUF4307 domain-containing protein [Actinomycetota bacterium]